MLPLHLLNKKGFISVATCSPDGQPNAAPKLICFADDQFVYLIDYTSGKTWENLRINPRVSLSLSDSEDLTGYKINGSVEILEGNAIPGDIKERLEDKKLSLSVDRVVRGVQKKKKHHVYEMGMPDQYVVYKVRVGEITRIGSQGDLRRETAGGDG
jgi:hypothetical protein